MSTIIPDVQILDQNDTWQSAIAGLMACQIDGGMAALASKPSVGRCDLMWANANQAYNPDPAGAAQVRQQYGWGEKFVILYGGNIGLAQGLDVFVEAARLLREHTSQKIVLCQPGV